MNYRDNFEVIIISFFDEGRQSCLLKERDLEIGCRIKRMQYF